MRGDSYAKFSEDYDRRWARFSQRTRAEVLAQLPMPLTNARLLDVGCGTGTLIADILAQRPAVGAITGVDASASMLEKAAEQLSGVPRGSEVTLVERRVDALDFPAASFDVVVCANVFHYLTDPVATLRRLRAALAPDGLLVLEDYSKRGLIARYGEWVIRWYDPAHRRAYTLPEASGLVTAAGFSVTHQADFPIDRLWRGWIVTARQRG